MWSVVFIWIDILEIRRENPPPEILSAEILQSLGTLAKETCRYAEAESRYRQSLEIRARQTAPSRLQLRQTAETCEGLAWVLRQDGRPTEAERFQARARTIRAEIGSKSITN